MSQLSKVPQACLSSHAHNYVASMYGGHWWLWCITEVCLDHEDYNQKQKERKQRRCPTHEEWHCP